MAGSAYQPAGTDGVAGAAATGAVAADVAAADGPHVLAPASGVVVDSGADPQPAGSAAVTAAVVAAASVPAGWYHDPAGRYELRYWDGSAWTEHVSRAGQQYTDPPVA